MTAGDAPSALGGNTAADYADGADLAHYRSRRGRCRGRNAAAEAPSALRGNTAADPADFADHGLTTVRGEVQYPRWLIGDQVR